MDEYQFRVQVLHRRTKSWRRVAEFIGGPRSHNYWRLLSENSQSVRLELDDKRRIDEAWKRRQIACTACTERNRRRKNITVSNMLYDRMNVLKAKFGVTWDELGQMMLERMEGL